ncbi:MAG: hypothetical protein RMJ19_03305 [Gemmatales bacterium]|nr:hypothetical protein [Gemmatales bacterium]MDW8174676.1 hypothetical protein [Gemmatales bacterium]
MFAVSQIRQIVTEAITQAPTSKQTIVLEARVNLATKGSGMFTVSMGQLDNPQIMVGWRHYSARAELFKRVRRWVKLYTKGSNTNIVAEAIERAIRWKDNIKIQVINDFFVGTWEKVRFSVVFGPSDHYVTRFVWDAPSADVGREEFVSLQRVMLESLDVSDGTPE